MRRLGQITSIILDDRYGSVASDTAIMFSLATLVSMVAMATAGIMPDEAVRFGLESLGGAIGLVE